MTDRPAQARSQILLQAATALGWSVSSRTAGAAGDILYYQLTPPGSQHPTVFFNASLLDPCEDEVPFARSEVARVLAALLQPERSQNDEMNAIRVRLAALEEWVEDFNKALDLIDTIQGNIRHSYNRNFPKGRR